MTVAYKISCVLMCLAVGLMFLMVAGCGKKPEPVAEKPTTIVFFGDSIVNGYGVPVEDSFYDRIRLVMEAGIYGNVRTINAGENGDDILGARQRLESDVLSHDPDFVVIAFGLNDCLNGSTDVASFARNMRSLIDAMPDDTEPVLATSNAFLDMSVDDWPEKNQRLEEYMSAIRTIAAERGIPVIEVHSAWENLVEQDSRHMETLYVDPVHPSARGHDLIYETYMNVLRRILVR